MKIGLIGAGSIGSLLGKAVDQMEDVEKLYIMDRSRQRARTLTESITKGVKIDNLEDLLSKSDLVIEAASQEAAEEIAPRVLERGKDLMLMSVGALRDENLRKRIETLAKKNGCKVHIPSGAIAGIDGLKSASADVIDEVMLITTKPPAALEGANLAIDLKSIKEPITLFEGSARDAVRRFPQNINVAATLSLSGIGFDRTLVKIVVDPDATRNTHKIIVRGKFGKLSCEVDNVPSPTNPKTSYLAALSAITALKNILAPIQIGT